MDPSSRRVTSGGERRWAAFRPGAYADRRIPGTDGWRTRTAVPWRDSGQVGGVDRRGWVVRVGAVRWPGRLDGVLAVGAAVAVVCGTVVAATAQVGHSAGVDREVDAVAVLLLVASAAVTVGWRRVAPLGALVGAGVLVNGYLLAGYPYGPVLLCLVVAVFEVARQRPLRVSAVAGGIAAGVASATMLVRLLADRQESWPLAVAWASWIVLPWSLGALVNAVGAARRRGRRELATAAALAERTRLAGEVHDIAGHAFALITMQAGVALLVFDEQPEQARRSLEAVRDTSSTALADLRRMLADLHPRPAGPADPTEVAGVAGLAELIGRVQAGGLPVTLTVDRCGEVPPALAPAVRRTVQEALTNVLRHAGPTTAEVTIGHRDRQVLVRVTDHGRGAPGTVRPPGRGLTGMRRRVEELDGRLEAGPRAGGGFEVTAWLPVPRTRPEPAR
jgi:signal transduction histidine kinase